MIHYAQIIILFEGRVDLICKVTCKAEKLTNVIELSCSPAAQLIWLLTFELISFRLLELRCYNFTTNKVSNQSKR